MSSWLTKERSLALASVRAPAAAEPGSGLRGVSVREPHADAAHLHERHAFDVGARAPRSHIGALVGLVAKVAAHDLGPVDDAHAVVVGLGVVRGAHLAAERVDREQLDDAADVSGLLVELAQGASLGMLTEVDAAAGQCPRARSLGDVAQS